MELLLLSRVEDVEDGKGVVVHVARAWRLRRKKRSGWKHPLDLERNRRRCEKRRRSASTATRHAVEVIRDFEAQLEVVEGRLRYQGLQRCDRFGRGGPERRSSRGLEPRRAWA